MYDLLYKLVYYSLISRDVKLQFRIDFIQTSTNTSIDWGFSDALDYMFAVVGWMIIWSITH